MTAPRIGHEPFVEGWLAARLEGASVHRRQAVALLRAGLRAVWSRVKTSLGEVTVTAIFRRVLVTTRRTHPLLDHVKLPAPAELIDLDESALGRTSEADVRAATRLVLVELLGVFGRLTGEALTPGLHAALSAIGAATLDSDAKDATRGKDEGHE